MPTPHISQAVRMTLLAYAIADRDAVASIQAQSTPTTLAGRPWMDTRAMVSEHEHAPQVLDMNREVLLYAHFRHLIVHHQAMQHLVRITPALQTACNPNPEH